MLPSTLRKRTNTIWILRSRVQSCLVHPLLLSFGACLLRRGPGLHSPIGPIWLTSWLSAFAISLVLLSLLSSLHITPLLDPVTRCMQALEGVNLLGVWYCFGVFSSFGGATSVRGGMDQATSYRFTGAYLVCVPHCAYGLLFSGSDLLSIWVGLFYGVTILSCCDTSGRVHASSQDGW